MQRQEISDLIRKYNAGTASEYEKGLVETWYMQFEQKEFKDLSHEEREEDLAKIWDKLPVRNQNIKRIEVWYRVAAAAVILVFISFGIYFAYHTSSGQQEEIQKIAKVTSPGSNKAILILNNGKQLVLTDAGKGQLTVQGNTAVTKTAEGEVVYKPGLGGRATDNTGYNTMVTPAGGTYSLTLADGTKVTLDAASSIRYPVAFTGNERRVEITGQAYFEVAHNKAKPFRVTTVGQTVEVLGTHFNIDAYADEASVKTTLLEGSVKVSKGGRIAFLTPGQRSVILPNSAAIKVEDADTETAIAWKDGIFKFKRADLQTVMQQFARWYNIEVVYDGKIPQVAITGKVLRNENAGRVLEILDKLGIKFKLDDKKIRILQNE